MAITPAYFGKVVVAITDTSFFAVVSPSSPVFVGGGEYWD
jgi:hypothetical protein